MFSTVLVVLFCGLVLQQTSLAEENYGYIMNYGFYADPCTTEPVPGECSFNYPVADFSRMRQSQAGQSPAAFVIAQINRNLEMMGGSMEGPKSSSTERCVTTYKKYFCKQNFQLTCTDEFIQQDIDGVKRSCKKAENYCANATDAQSLYLKFMINCSTPIEPIGPMKRPILKCARFPEVKEDPLPCDKRKYKVAVVNLTEQVRNQVAAHERLARYASNISEECCNDVAEMICKTAAPACDRNETKVVELLSRQDCERILSCLNTTPKVENLKQGMLEWCRHSPDANTAKKIPLSLVYTEFEDITTPQTYNDTKTTTAPASENPVPNKTVQTERRNASDESYDPKTTTRPYINTTDHTTSQKPTTKPENTPTPQANISKQNAKSNPLTQTPTVNATYQEKKTEKSFPNLKPTTESVLNLSETTQDHHDRSELNKTTPHVNVTSLLVVSRVNATARPVLNVTATRHTVSVGNSTNVVNKAAQLNPRVNKLAISLLISILTICMW